MPHKDFVKMAIGCSARRVYTQSNRDRSFSRYPGLRIEAQAAWARTVRLNVRHGSLASIEPVAGMKSSPPHQHLTAARRFSDSADARRSI